MPQNLLEHVSASYLLLRLVGYQSSWRSTEDFQYTRPHLLGRSLSLVFLAPTAWRLTGSAIWRRGSVTTYWGSASRGTWRKTARRVWSAYFFFSANVVEVPSAVSRVVKDSLSLGSSALHVQDVRSGNKQVCCQPFSTHLFFLVQVGISEQELCISWLQRRMLVVV
ncbi:hypothetical protein TNCV_1807611 [Trichonephila clavipes]|nr:hypothetical protein TNCV_5037821 [Trichonephila clavipes]GFV73111.1 hypothetical protein TNCV_3665281 [Trichonephila clavipes]GFX68206.1 hypothetical protein TNCV_1807611 [Trichonephila clavipes]